MSNAIGIDFGTTKSYLAYINRDVDDNNVPPTIATYSQENESITPLLKEYPYSTHYQIQPVPTLLSMAFPSNNPEHHEIRAGFSSLYLSDSTPENYQIVRNLKDRTRRVKGRDIQVNGKEYPLEGLIGYFLWVLKTYADQIRDQTDKLGVTITVPAQANSLQRLTMQIAAKVAGFEGEIDIVEEPVAAFLYHRHMAWDSFKTSTPAHALVVDFGGGTCDLAVIRYQDNKLPIVVNRYMAYIGGETIDGALLEHFWLREKTEIFPLSLDDYMDLDGKNKAVIRAHVRRMKEDLTNGEPFHNTSIKGVVLDNYVGNLETPKVSREEFLGFIQNHIFEKIKYGDYAKLHSNTIKGHLQTLIRSTLFGGNQSRPPIRIDKVILAGGSIQLPFIREWVKEGLEENNRQSIQEKDISDLDNNLCVANGAAIHQLYVHHRKKDWRGAATPTLPWNIVLIHNFNREGNEEEISLGKMGETLPIDASGYYGRSIFINPAVRPLTVEPYYAISLRYSDESMDSEKIHLNDAFGSRFSSIAWTQGIHIAYAIDKYGVIEDIKLSAKSLMSIFSKGVSVEQPLVGEDVNFIEILRKLQGIYKSKNEISKLRRQYIPRV